MTLCSSSQKPLWPTVVESNAQLIIIKIMPESSDFLIFRGALKSITIGLYIRDPLETAVSAYSSLLLANRAGSRLPAANQPYILNLCDHAATIARWKRCFPDARLVVRHFEEAKLSLGDIKKDFCLQFLQVDPCAIGMLPKRLNESYSLKGLTYIQWLNRVMPPRGGALATRLRYLAIDYLGLPE